MSPQNRAKKLLGGSDPAAIFAKAPLLVIVDRADAREAGGLSDFAFRVYALLAAVSFRHGNAQMSHDEIAYAMGCSERAARRAVLEIERAGYATVARKHNVRNVYKISSPFTQDRQPALEEPAPTGKQPICHSCSKPRKGLGPGGICRGCATRAEQTRQYRLAWRNLGTSATHREICEHLHLEKLSSKLLGIRRDLERGSVA